MQNKHAHRRFEKKSGRYFLPRLAAGHTSVAPDGKMSGEADFGIGIS
jgi:hypothetical protein